VVVGFGRHVVVTTNVVVQVSKQKKKENNMARMAQRDQENRITEVNREKLVAILKRNRDDHLCEYREAMEGYKSVLSAKIDDAFENAKKTLEVRYSKTKARVEKFTDADIANQQDYFTLIDSITVEMKVPRSYHKQYDAAIAMAEWDVRETLELSHAEFTCFVQNEWDWSSGFDV